MPDQDRLAKLINGGQMLGRRPYPGFQAGQPAMGCDVLGCPRVASVLAPWDCTPNCSLHAGSYVSTAAIIFLSQTGVLA
jgi:hypothetical protein